MAKYKISGVPICENGKLVGILTNRDLRFLEDYDLPIKDVMTKEHLVTAPMGTTMEQAQEILRRHKIEKLPLVDKEGRLMGLITIKDIEKAVRYPNSARDPQGRLLCGAAIGATSDVLDRAKALSLIHILPQRFHLLGVGSELDRNLLPGPPRPGGTSRGKPVSL